MGIAQKIADYAGSLFDVVGATRRENGDKLLILGLESTPERNLDEFRLLGVNFQLHGFKKHARPRLSALIDLIISQGFSAEPIGRYGYPLRGEVSLKKEALYAGLGRRGKNTVILHPKYGSRLRFMAIRTDAPLKLLTISPLTEEENPICVGCSICVDACPVQALEPYSMPDTSICLSNTDNMTEEQGRLIPCDMCLHLCPVGRS